MSMPAVQYENVADARAHLKDLLDAAVGGAPASLRRDAQRIALVDAVRLRHYLASLNPRAQVVAEAGGWSVFIPGVPVAADGASFDEAIAEMVFALREYAEDWIDHLSVAPNHTDNWGLVQLVALSSDDELADWLSGGLPAAR
jgi:hypothetical protein